MFHHKVPHNTGGVHTPFNWVVADETARLALVVTALDVYKACWQIDTAEIYILTDVAPVTWEAISSNNGSSSFRGFHAIKATNVAVAAGSVLKVIFPTEQYDPAGDYDAVNSKIIPQILGWWEFGTQLVTTTGVTGALIGPKLYKNGSLLLNAGFQHGTSTNIWGSPVIFPPVQITNLTDYFEIFCYTSHANGFAATDSSVWGKYLGT